MENKEKSRDVQFLRDELIRHVNYITHLSNAISVSSSSDEVLVQNLLDKYEKDSTSVKPEDIVPIIEHENYKPVFELERMKVGSRIRLMYQIAGDDLFDKCSDNAKNVAMTFIKDDDFGFMLKDSMDVVEFLNEEKVNVLRSNIVGYINTVGIQNIVNNISESFRQYKERIASFNKRLEEVEAASRRAVQSEKDNVISMSDGKETVETDG